MKKTDEHAAFRAPLAGVRFAGFMPKWKTRTCQMCGARPGHSCQVMHLRRSPDNPAGAPHWVTRKTPHTGR